MTGPACVFNLPVLCGVSGLPQVPLNLAGANKSNASSGVRHDIYSWLAASSPAPGDGDGNPSYDAINSGINALKAFPMVGGKRVLVYITDGGASCTSVTNRPGYVDGNTCNDWEYPDSIVTLLKNAHDDTQTKINSFIVGVPGADTDGSNPNTPPYHVRNALSAYAYAGSPETVDPACDGKVFSKTGADPSVVCHFDMSQTYTSTKLSDAIKSIRGKVMGCTFDLPSADGGMVDKTKVNVTYSANGGVTIDLLKRSNPSDPCTASGCWDYDGNGKVELFGKACTDLQTAATANVHVLLGCDTNIK